MFCFPLKSVTAILALNFLTFAASGVWLDVPFVKQEKNACGAAVIAMVMQYWQRQMQTPADDLPDPIQIQRAIYSDEAKGTYASEMEHYLKVHGFRTFAFRGELADLQQHLEKGRPLIVALKAGPGALHYVVVTGIDSTSGVVIKNDPAERKLLKQTQSEFEKQWREAGNWTLLAVPLTDGPPSISPPSSH